MSFLKKLEKGAKKAGKKASKSAKKAGKSIGKGTKSAVKAVKKGAKGADIKEAQKALKKKLKVDVKIDGQFGPKMEDLIKQAQKKAKIKQTGIMDEKTQAWLGMSKAIAAAAISIDSAAEAAGDTLAALAGKTTFLKPLQAQYNQSKKMKAELEKRLAKVATLLTKAADDAQVAQMVVAIIHAEIKVITTILETMIRTQQEGVKLLTKVDKMAG